MIFSSELQIVKNTTSDVSYRLPTVLHADEITAFQHLVRRVPVVDNVVEYAVKLVHQTRPNTAMGAAQASQYLEWWRKFPDQLYLAGYRCYRPAGWLINHHYFW